MNHENREGPDITIPDISTNAWPDIRQIGHFVGFISSYKLPAFCSNQETHRNVDGPDIKSSDIRLSRYPENYY